jgi:hypothetical protein
MSGYTKKVLVLAGVLFPVTLLGTPSSGSAQAAVGGQLAWTPDLLNESTLGVGARVIVPLPVAGMALQGTVDFFMPDCGSLECNLRDAGLGILWMPPVGTEADLYVGGGVAVQDSEGTWILGDDREVGVSLRGGAILGGRAFTRFRPFGEARYQIMGGDFPNQLVLSGGIFISLHRSP